MAEQGQPQTTIRELRTSLVATTAVVITILLAIFLAAADSLQERLPVPIRPEATTMVADVVETATPAPAVTLPGPTPSPTASPSPAQTPTVTATSSSIVASSGCGFIPAGWVPYVVRRGDTLFHLSITSGATINEITQANCLGMSVLTAGTVIYLPYAPPSRPACGPPQWWVRYTVQRGDTLYSLARQRGTTVYEIMQANCLVSVYIQAGRQIFGHAAPGANRHAPTHAFGHGQPDNRTNSQPNGQQHAGPYSHGHATGHADQHQYADAQPQRHAAAHGHTHPHRHAGPAAAAGRAINGHGDAATTDIATAHSASTDGYGRASAAGHGHGQRHADGHFQPAAYAAPGANRHAPTHAFGHGQPDNRTNSQPNGQQHAGPYSHGHATGHADQHQYADAQPQRHAAAHGHTHPHRHAGTLNRPGRGSIALR
jgi:LysM repeat protein